jgi:hypothetical protein
MVSGTGPEALGQLGGVVRHVPHPAVQEARAVQMHDDRVGLGTALGLEDLAHRRRVLRVGAEAVDGFRRERDQLTVAQSLHGGFDLDLGCADDTYHGREF